MTKSNKGRWYTKEGGEIHGPFPNKLIGSYLILGRINQDTLVSKDKKNWSPVSKYPAMVPDVVKEAGTIKGDHALMLARIREDERTSNANEDDGDRRENEEHMMQLHRQIRNDVLQSYQSKPYKHMAYFGVSGLVLFIIVGLLLSANDRDRTQADCDLPAVPRVNWSSCNKQGESLNGFDLRRVNFRNAKLHSANLSEAKLQEADLAYADLSGSNLALAELKNANLKGANLRQANLQGADLTSANFSYAELVGSQLEGVNFKNAIFDYAVWVNGEICLPGSVGACLLPLEE